MTMDEIVAVIDRPAVAAWEAVRRVRQRAPGQVFRIVKYRRVKQRYGLRPVYAAGPGPDVPRMTLPEYLERATKAGRERTRRRQERARLQHAREHDCEPLVENALAGIEATIERARLTVSPWAGLGAR